MKTSQEWYQECHDKPQISRAASEKWIRDIQIDALRHALEMVEHHGHQHEWTGAISPNPALPSLDKLIRELELR